MTLVRSGDLPWLVLAGLGFAAATPPIAWPGDADEIPRISGVESAPATAAPGLRPDELIRDWWRGVQEELLDGAELSSDQRRQIAAVVERDVEQRARTRKLQRGLAQAQRQRDSERARLLLEALRRQRQKLHPARRLDEMRSVLTEPQRQPFDEKRRIWRQRLRADAEVVPAATASDLPSSGPTP